MLVYTVLCFECAMSPIGFPRLDTWALAGGTVRKSCGTIRRWSLVRGNGSLGVGFEAVFGFVFSRQDLIM